MFKYHIKGKITPLDDGEIGEEIDDEFVVDSQCPRVVFKKWLEQNAFWDEDTTLTCIHTKGVFSAFAGSEDLDFYLTAELIG